MTFTEYLQTMLTDDQIEIVARNLGRGIRLILEKM